MHAPTYKSCMALGCTNLSAGRAPLLCNALLQGQCSVPRVTAVTIDKGAKYKFLSLIHI